MSEHTKTLAAAIRMMSDAGTWWIKIHGTPYGRRGVPDLLICRNGRFIAAEIKPKREKPTRLQMIEIDRIQAAGGRAAVVRSGAEMAMLLEGDTPA